MARYRKKPVVIDAEQWFPGKYVLGVIGYNHTDREEQHMSATGLFFSVPSGCGYMDTLEGTHIVTAGDWIITGVQGERYPCKPDIFEKTYEPVEEDK